MVRWMAFYPWVFGILCGLVIKSHADENDWTTIYGRVVWGHDSRPEPHEVSKPIDDAEWVAPTGRLRIQRWHVNDKLEIKDVVVAIESPTRIHPSARLQKDVIRKEFLSAFKQHTDMDLAKWLDNVSLADPDRPLPPDVVTVHKAKPSRVTLALPAGQPLVIWNRDRVNHYFRFLPLSSDVDTHPIESQSGQRHRTDVPVGDGVLVCRIHSWMKVDVHVFDHRYFTTTDEDGRFEIRNVPAGPVKIRVIANGTHFDVSTGKETHRRRGTLTDVAGRRMNLGNVALFPDNSK